MAKSKRLVVQQVGNIRIDGLLGKGRRRQWHMTATKGVARHAANSSSPQD